MERSMEQIKRFFGEDIPFTTYLYDLQTGSIGLGEATTLILKENVCNIEEDELFVFDKVNRRTLNMRSSNLQLILKKDAVLVLRYDDLVLLCIAEPAELFKALLKRSEREQIGLPDNLPISAPVAVNKVKQGILLEQ